MPHSKIVINDATLKLSSELLQNEFKISAQKLWYIADVGVKKGLRNQGICTEMMQKIINLLPDDTSLILRVLQEKKQVIKLYQKFGFQFKFMERFTTTVIDGSKREGLQFIMIKT